MTKLCGVALAVFVLGQSTVRALARSEPVQGEVLSSDTDDSFDSLSGLEVHDQVVTSQLHPSSTRSFEQLQDSIKHRRDSFFTRTLTQEAPDLDVVVDDAAGGDPDEQLGIDSASGLVAVQDPVEETVPELGNTEDAGQVVNDPQVQALPQTDDGSAVEENAPEASPERTEVSVMIGIMSDVSGTPEEVLDAVDRRESARRSWLKLLNSYPDIQARFVVGPPRVLNPDTPGVDFEPAISNLYGLLEDEQKTFPDQFLSVDVEDCETCGARKYLAFLAATMEKFEAKYFLRISDSTLVAPKNLAMAAQQWTDINAAYTGCMASKVQRWNEARKRQVVLPQHSDRDLIGSQYPAFAHLDAFAVAGSVAEVALVPNKHNLRQLEHEDTSVGLWMLGLRVNFFNDTRLCASPCTSSTQAQTNPSRRLSQDLIDDIHSEQRALSQDQQQAAGDVEFMPHLHHGAVPHNPRAFVCTVARAPESTVEQVSDDLKR